LAAPETVQLHETKHDGSHHGEDHAETHGKSHDKGDGESHDKGDGEGHGEGHEVYKQKTFGRGEMSSTIGCMLIGNVAFQMSLYYLVNHNDEDMRRYTWTVIGTTISIFSAVLLFQSVEGLLDVHVIEDLSEISKLGVHLMHMSVWFVLTQVVVYLILKYENYIEKASHTKSQYESLVCPSAAPETHSSRHGGCLSLCGAGASSSTQRKGRWKVKKPKFKEDRNKAAERAKSIGGLFAHITAFAGISAFKVLQDMLEVHSLGPCAPLIAALVFFGYFHVAWMIRDWIIFDDGKVEQEEHEWEKHVCEIEDDIIALCTSYLITRSVARFIEGGDPLHEHDRGQVGMMFAAAVVSLVAMIVIVNFWNPEHEHGASSEGNHAHNEPKKLVKQKTKAERLEEQRKKTSIPEHRMAEISKYLCTFCFAWCSLEGCTWVIMFFQNIYGWTHIWMEVCEALIVSFLCVLIIWVLDKVADEEFTPDEVDEVIEDSVMGFGVLIGFCWEHAFNVGVISISRRFVSNQDIAQFVMCVGIVIIVFPAYVMYIVPVQFHETKPTEEKEEEEEGKSPADEHVEVTAAVTRGPPRHTATALTPLPVKHEETTILHPSL
jgi:hypothetical protein